MPSLVPFSFAGLSCEFFCGSQASLFDSDLMLPRYLTHIPN
jgi:hypothetical protein